MPTQLLDHQHKLFRAENKQLKSQLEAERKRVTGLEAKLVSAEAANKIEISPLITHLRSSVIPPSPMLVKKLMANLCVVSFEAKIEVLSFLQRSLLFVPEIIPWKMFYIVSRNKSFFNFGSENSVLDLVPLFDHIVVLPDDEKSETLE